MTFACPTCRHEAHAGHQYEERGFCNGCRACLEFQRAYHRAERDYDPATLTTLDAEWAARTGNG